MPDVFAHAMLSMAYLGRLLTQWVDQREVRRFNACFAGITHLGHEITCTLRCRTDRSARHASGSRRLA